MISAGILFAFVTMLTWGIADVFAKKAIEKTGEMKPLLYGQVVGTVPIIIYAAAFLKIPLISLEIFALGAISGFLTIAAYLSFYKGMKKGNLAIVNPITGSYTLITTLLGMIFFQESLKFHHMIAIALVFVGAFLASADLKRIKLKIVPGVPEAVFAMLGFGVGLFIIKFVSVATGAIISFLLLRIVGLFILLAYSSLSKIDIKLPSGSVLGYITLVGILDAIGQLGFNAAITMEQMSLVAPVIAGFPAVTVILAILFLKERPAFSQKIGIVSILAGLVLISAI
ncbi:MAG: DMT family transporter [Candidatus Aenigmatarchaeota archaeon]